MAFSWAKRKRGMSYGKPHKGKVVGGIGPKIKTNGMRKFKAKVGAGVAKAKRVGQSAYAAYNSPANVRARTKMAKKNKRIARRVWRRLI